LGGHIYQVLSEKILANVLAYSDQCTDI
jgi:hypothetical protein